MVAGRAPVNRFQIPGGQLRARRGAAIRPGAHGLPVGFTLIEVLIVLTIVGIIASVSVPRISTAMAAGAVVQARDAIVWTGGIARSAALERGEAVKLVVDPSTDRMQVVVVRNDSIIRTRDLSEDGVSIETEGGGTLTVCYAARGWALAACSDALPQTVRFVRSGQETSATIRPLGQVQR